MTTVIINNSTNFLELSDKINVIISILIVCIGLIGNTLSLIILVLHTLYIQNCQKINFDIIKTSLRQDL